MKSAIRIWGTENDKPVKSAKGAALSAGLNDFSFVNIFVVRSRTIRGRSVLPIAWGRAVQKENCDINAVFSVKPKALRAAVTGVPTAPKETAEESKTSVIIAAAIGGNPRLTSKGPASAAGVPKPAADSINEQKEKPIIQA